MRDNIALPKTEPALSKLKNSFNVLNGKSVVGNNLSAVRCNFKRNRQCSVRLNPLGSSVPVHAKQQCTVLVVINYQLSVLVKFIHLPGIVNKFGVIMGTVCRSSGIKKEHRTHCNSSKGKGYNNNELVLQEIIFILFHNLID